mmetsp:Transcript_11983/g.15307  ORF Transcript_11983/g.15307 Transcript_11983/m.15307 type:complete len:83 (-) Transcript_11983:179-427(-)
MTSSGFEVSDSLAAFNDGELVSLATSVRLGKNNASKAEILNEIVVFFPLSADKPTFSSNVEFAKLRRVSFATDPLVVELPFG